MTAEAVGAIMAYFKIGLYVGASPVIATILIGQLVAAFRDIVG